MRRMRQRKLYREFVHSQVMKNRGPIPPSIRGKIKATLVQLFTDARLVRIKVIKPSEWRQLKKWHQRERRVYAGEPLVQTWDPSAPMVAGTFPRVEKRARRMNG